MTIRRLFSFRLEPELVARFDARALKDHAPGLHDGRRGSDIGRTAAIEILMDLYAEGRLMVLPLASSSAFPVEEIALGASPDHPIPITPLKPGG